MDIRKIKTLIEMLEESNLNEIEVSQGEESVRISKSSRNTSIVSGSVNQNNIENIVEKFSTRSTNSSFFSSAILKEKYENNKLFDDKKFYSVKWLKEKLDKNEI